MSSMSAISSKAQPPAADPRCRHGEAFTLVELLVIVAVIALLLGVIAPSMERVTRIAHTVICSSNVHQLGTAAHCYADDNGGYLPRDVWPNQTGHYLFAARFLPYVGGRPLPAANSDNDYNAAYDALAAVDVFRCPGVDMPQYVLNYVVSGWDVARYQTGQGYQSSPAVPVSHLPFAPGEALYIAEFSPRYQSPKSFGTYDVWVPGHMPFNGLVPNPNPRMIHAEDTRHFGDTTVAFFDGHAEKRRLDPYDVPVSLLNPLDTSYDPP